jgi:hypothetical protein
MITGGTIHSEARKRGIEGSSKSVGGSARDPQSPVDAVEKCGDVTTLRLRHANSEH